MIDMTILIVGLIAVIGLAVAFFGLSNNSIDDSSPLLAGVSNVRKFYENCLKKKKNKPTVLYISIFYENLQIMMERKELMYIREQVEREVLQLCSYAHGEAARVDGNNYVVSTDLKKDVIEDFCNGFLGADKKGFKKIGTYIGVYTASGSDKDFLKSAGYAKKASRAAKADDDKYRMADKDSLQYIIENDNIERNIETFIDNNDFYQMYQPFVDAQSRAIIGCEALTRLKDKDVNNILPVKLLNALKKQNLYEKFDLYVFGKCCEWAAKRSDKNVIITCKLVKSTLEKPDIAEDIINIAEKTGIRNDMIMIAVSQDGIDQDWESFRKNIVRLKKEGFKFCLDNFGKDYSSLGDISKLAPDAIKLDRSLLYDGLAGPGRIIFDNIVKLAKEVNAVVLCGGIETPEQKTIAEEAGCDLLQGFYFYTSLTEEEFDKLLTIASHATESSEIKSEIKPLKRNNSEEINMNKPYEVFDEKKGKPKLYVKKSKLS